MWTLLRENEVAEEHNGLMQMLSTVVNLTLSQRHQHTHNAIKYLLSPTGCLYYQHNTSAIVLLPKPNNLSKVMLIKELHPESLSCSFHSPLLTGADKAATV